MKASSHVPPMTLIPVDTSFSDASPIQGRVGCCGLVAKRELGYRTPNTGTRMWRCGPVASVRGNNRSWTPVNMMSLRTPEHSSSSTPQGRSAGLPPRQYAECSLGRGLIHVIHRSCTSATTIQHLQQSYRERYASKQLQATIINRRGEHAVMGR